MVKRAERQSRVTYKITKGFYIMEQKKYIYWENDDMWLGYFEEYPDYLTHGETLEELEDNLRDIHSDLSGGSIPHVRKAALLDVA